jgi:ribosomal protein S1
MQAKDLSWCRVVQPEQMVRVGDEVTVGVVGGDSPLSQTMVHLTMRIEQNKPEIRFPQGSRARGTVVNVLPEGALVRLAPGVMGWVHMSELTWKGEIPAQVVEPGQVLTVRVLDVKLTDPRTMNLTLKAAFRAQFRIPLGRIGAVIGTGGRVIKEIKAATDTEIHINSEDGRVTVLGSDLSKVEEARARIAKIAPVWSS